MIVKIILTCDKEISIFKTTERFGLVSEHGLAVRLGPANCLVEPVGISWQAIEIVFQSFSNSSEGPLN